MYPGISFLRWQEMQGLPYQYPILQSLKQVMLKLPFWTSHERPSVWQLNPAPHLIKTPNISVDNFIIVGVEKTKINGTECPWRWQQNGIQLNTTKCRNTTLTDSGNIKISDQCLAARWERNLWLFSQSCWAAAEQSAGGGVGWQGRCAYCEKWE